LGDLKEAVAAIGSPPPVLPTTTVIKHPTTTATATGTAATTSIASPSASPSPADNKSPMPTPNATPTPTPTPNVAATAATPKKDADGKDIPPEFYESNPYHPLSKAAETQFLHDQEAAKHAAQLVAQLAAQKAALDDGTPQKDFRFLYYASKFPEFFDATREKTPARVMSPEISADEKRDVWTRGTKDARACVRELCTKYLESLVWVLQYYYAGCTSWKWFFPYRYAPLASDMTGLADMKVEFELGQPFRPMEQLMAVLPPASAKVYSPTRRTCRRDLAFAFA
jgi:5'-3' exoribonuclease 2